MQKRIAIEQEALAVFCRRHHILRLSLFVSTLKGKVNPDSDVDFLVEFERGCAPDSSGWREWSGSCPIWRGDEGSICGRLRI